MYQQLRSAHASSPRSRLSGFGRSYRNIAWRSQRGHRAGSPAAKSCLSRLDAGPDDGAFPSTMRDVYRDRRAASQEGPRHDPDIDLHRCDLRRARILSVRRARRFPPAGGDDRRYPSRDPGEGAHSDRARRPLPQAYRRLQRPMRHRRRGRQRLRARRHRADREGRQGRRPDDAQHPRQAVEDGHRRRRPRDAGRAGNGPRTRRGVRPHRSSQGAAAWRGVRHQGPVRHLRHALDQRRCRRLCQRPAAARCDDRGASARRRRHHSRQGEHGRIRRRRPQHVRRHDLQSL